MKKCPACAERIQDAAYVCRFCGYEFSHDEVDAAKRSENIVRLIFIGLMTVTIGLMFRSCASKDDVHPAAQLSREPIRLDDKTVKECRKLIDRSQKLRVVRRFVGNRIDVEDWKWAALPADSKKGLLLAVGCVEFRSKLDQVDKYTVAYGYRSGKRLAMATSVGFDLN